MFKELKEKLKADAEIRKPYMGAVFSTLVKTAMCGIAVVCLNTVKEGAEAEREIYVNKMAQDRAERTILKAEMQKQKNNK